MVLGLGPTAFQSPNHFSITALASSGETSPMTTMVVRSGLMVAEKYCFTWSKLIVARVAGVDLPQDRVARRQQRQIQGTRGPVLRAYQVAGNKLGGLLFDDREGLAPAAPDEVRCRPAIERRGRNYPSGL